MRYRSLRKAPGTEVSILGFGCARLPALDGDAARIDEDLATELLRDAVDAGVNYVETSPAQHGGASERLAGRALEGARRARVHLGTRVAAGAVAGDAAWERLLDERLARLRTDHVEFLLLDGMSRSRWEQLRGSSGLGALERARADGRVAHLGFSFQGPPAAFREILEGRDWDCCELELNLLDDGAVALEGLRRAAARGVGVLAAEPLRGDALASPPPVVQDAWARSERPWSPAQWALRWVWDHAGVITAVSGFASAGRLRESLDAADAADPLSPGDRELVAAVKRVYRTRRRVPCTICGTCRPCAAGIEIPDVLSLYNDAMFDAKAGPAAEYASLVRSGRGVDRCTACGECELRCPESLPLVERLREAHAYLTGAAAPPTGAEP